jgi:uncharacterized protein involved in copper resistance
LGTAWRTGILRALRGGIHENGRRGSGRLKLKLGLRLRLKLKRLLRKDLGTGNDNWDPGFWAWRI